MTMTGYFTHPSCRKHEMMPGHPECPERLDAIDDRLLISGLDVALDRREATAAAVSDIELAHDRMYVAAIRGLNAELQEQIAAGGHDQLQIDPDTSINMYTWDAALNAAGAAIDATDAVMAGVTNCRSTPTPASICTPGMPRSMPQAPPLTPPTQ